MKWSVTLTDRLGPEIFASCAFACEGSWLVAKLECAPN